MSTPRRIAILGGGVGSIGTALQLTSEPDWQSRYDITVYQMGWRLGGKGASGRDGESLRILEHGLHIWLGFYENAFRIMRAVYAENENNLPPGAPLRQWDQFFRPHSFIALTEAEQDQWLVWPVHFPDVPGTPGDGKPLTLWDGIIRAIGWLKELFEDSSFHRTGGGATEPGQHSGLLDGLRAVWDGIETAAITELAALLTLAAELAARTARQAAPHQALAGLLEHFRRHFREAAEGRLDGDYELRRLFLLLDTGCTILMGLLRGGYLLDEARLDELEQDLQVWLAEQGAHPLAASLATNAALRGLYDLVFAFDNGEEARPSFATGPALRSILLIVGCYKGSVFWKMQAGMGDVVFAPMYQVLRDRGVRFEFFHNVEALHLDAAGSAIEAIDIGRQVTLRDPAKPYEPLIDALGVPSWPAQPRYEQIVEAAQLQKDQINLESFWTPWKNVAMRRLERGRDFDTAVLGISLGALPYLFSDVAALPAPFQQMLQNVGTVRTQAMQVWLTATLEQLGWTRGSVVLDAFVDPMNTWAVMDQLLPRESWPPGAVNGIHYFCGQMEGGIAPRGDTGFPARELAQVERNGRKLLEQLAPLWPHAFTDGRFREELLTSIFFRVNIDPTERYVLSLAGSTKYRLKANESGIANLVLAGDWTNNGFNAGCVEAAIMSAIMAANAIEGKPLGTGITGPLAGTVRGSS